MKQPPLDHRGSDSSRASSTGVPTGVIKVFFDDSSYHGAIKGVEAEKRLKERGGNCCLTRFSKARSVYVLSVYRGDDENPQFAHFDILIHVGDGIWEETEYEIVGTEQRFRCIYEMLDYYYEVPLNHQINGVGDVMSSERYAKDVSRAEPWSV